MPSRCDPEGTRLSIKLDSTSNGEFVPVPLDPTAQCMNRLARDGASENARPDGIDAEEVIKRARGGSPV